MDDKKIISNLEFQVYARNDKIIELEKKIALLKRKNLEKNKEIRELLNKIKILEEKNINLVRMLDFVADNKITSRPLTKRKKPKTYTDMMKEQGRW